MKKIFCLAVIAVSLSSYTEMPPDERMSPVGNGQDIDETVTITNGKTGLARAAVLCPGTGHQCTIQYTDSDGDTIIYSSRKGKGQPDIEL